MTNMALLDVSLASDNAGDHVITQAVDAAFAGMNLNGWSVRVPTHRRPRLRAIRKLADADTIILGGSNILSSNLVNHHQWRLWPDLMMALRHRVIFCGVGWNHYADSFSAVSQHAIKWMAKPGVLHSARDAYTTSKLQTIGLDVANTGCPTTWSLQKVSARPSPSDGAIVTITDYRRDHEVDRKWLMKLLEVFSRVRLVPMGESDAQYAHELSVRGVEILSHGLDTLNGVLHEDVVHVGTRLHAGVRCLQRNRPSIVFAVDNRAAEISRDTGLPIANRTDPEFLSKIDWNADIELDIPTEAISRWKNQFADELR